MLGKRQRPVGEKLPENHPERLRKERKFAWGEPLETQKDNDGESRLTRSKGQASPLDFNAFTSCVLEGKEYRVGGFALVSDDRKESVLQIEDMGEIEGRCVMRGQLLADLEDLKQNQIRSWLAKWGESLVDVSERFCRNSTKIDEIPISEVVRPCTVLKYDDFKKFFKNGKPPLHHFYVSRCLMKHFSGTPLVPIGFKQFLLGPSWRAKRPEAELNGQVVVAKEKPSKRTTVKEADEDESVSEVESSGDEFADAEADGGESESSANESDADGSEEEDSASASEASSEDERRSAKRPRKTARAVIEPLVYDSPKTPTSRKPTRKLMSASAKAARSLTLEARGTPRSAPTTPFEKARQSLHVAAVPKALPCREKEFEDIESYIEDAILDGSGSCVYISGVPGTGKTATATRVIDSLREKSERGDLDPFTSVEINGMKLLDPSQAYVILWEAISGERLSAAHAETMLERKFSRSSAHTRPIVVIMDELDLMATQKHKVMYNFFDWPSREQSQLIVIAIANTMDLPERMFNNRVASRLAMKRINFQPYTIPQLKTIIRSRLDGVELFEDSAIEFCARKIASVSGDARRALDVCRRAVEIADASAGGDVTKMKNKINIQMLLNTFNDMYASSNVKFIKHSALQHKIFLIALAIRIRRSGLHEVPFAELAEEHMRLCRMHKFEIPNGSQLSAICGALGASRAITVDDPKLDLYRSVRLMLSEQDVYHAVQEDPRLRSCLPTDLQAAWE